MLLRLRMLGTGTMDDAFRVPLPTWEMLDCDYANMIALVDVPDSDLPPALRELAPSANLDYLNAHREAVSAAAEGETPVAAAPPPAPEPVSLDPVLLEAWVNHLDERYQEHAGEYSPELV